jgi:hypothetical protein
MNKETKQQILQDLDRESLLSTKFLYITARDIVIASRKYFPNARPKDRKSGSDFASTYIYLIRSNLDNSERDYSYRILATQLSMKHHQNVWYYINRHKKRWEESSRYRERIFMILYDLKKTESIMKNEFQKKISEQ